jgi:hypothetical protein
MTRARTQRLAAYEARDARAADVEEHDDECALLDDPLRNDCDCWDDEIIYGESGVA